MGRSQKGTSKERELRARILDAGYGCIRAAASGGGGDQELPDLMASFNGDYYWWEMKYCGTKDKSGNYVVRFSTEELEELRRAAERWDATPEALARYFRDTSFYRIPLSYFEDHDAKTKSVRKVHAVEYPTVSDLM